MDNISEIEEWAKASGLKTGAQLAMLEQMGFGLIFLNGDSSDTSEGNLVMMNRRDAVKLSALMVEMNEMIRRRSSSTERVVEKVVEKVVYVGGPLKGQSAYERRMAGEKWAEIGPGSIENARGYAKSRGLEWPLKTASAKGAIPLKTEKVGS